MGKKGVSKRKPSKPKNMPVSNTDATSPSYTELKSSSLVPRVLKKGEAITISENKKKVSTEVKKKK